MNEGYKRVVVIQEHPPSLRLALSRGQQAVLSPKGGFQISESTSPFEPRSGGVTVDLSAEGVLGLSLEPGNPLTFSRQTGLTRLELSINHGERTLSLFTA